MEIYTGHCSYCNKSIKYQNNWIRHCKTKKHLKNKNEYLKTAQNPHKPSQNPHKTLTNIQKPSQSIEKDIKKEHNCEYCSKTFKRKDNLKRHIDKYCKVKKKENEKDELIKELKKQLESKNGNGNTTNNNINTTNNNNNTTNNTLNDNKTINNINLNVFGKEAILFDHDFLHELANNQLTDLERCQLILDRIYIEKEENRTLRITNERSTLGKNFNGTDWIAAIYKQNINNRIRRLPITYNRGAKECINNLTEADENYKKEQLDIHSKFSEQIRKETLNNRKEVKDLYDKHKFEIYKYTTSK